MDPSNRSDRTWFNRAMRDKGVPAKVCAGCLVVKAYTQFHKRAQSADGRQSRCIACDHSNHRQWCKANSVKVKTYNAKSYTKHADGRKAKQRQWARENPSKLAEQSANRRARKRGNRDYIGLPDREWQRLVHRFSGRCAYCGDLPGELHRDHVVALSRGGRHAPSNILPACPSCNYSKGTLLLSEWRRIRDPERRWTL